MSLYYDLTIPETGVPKRYQNVFLKDLAPLNKEQEKVKELLLSLLDDKTWCVTIIGTVGNGKTTLATAAVSQFIKDDTECCKRVYYTTQDHLIDACKAGIDDPNSESTTSIINRYRWAELIVIDELNPNTFTDYTKNTIQKIIVDRHANELKTILIGNLTGKQIKEMFEPHVISRLHEGVSYSMTAKDMRIKGEIL